MRESSETRIFLTGRPHVGGAIQRYFMNPVVIPVNPNTDGIRRFPEMKADAGGDGQQFTG